jgi:DNA helicase INO80
MIFCGFPSILTKTRTIGEGSFDDGTSHEHSGAATPSGDSGAVLKKRKGISKKAKTISQRLAVIDGEVG